MAPLCVLHMAKTSNLLLRSIYSNVFIVDSLQFWLHTKRMFICFLLQKDMTFEDVVKRVATPGGITEEGTKVVYEEFPGTADKIFEKTLEKRRQTAAKNK